MGRVRQLGRVASLVVAAFLIVVGAILIPTPIPFGVPLVALGLALAVGTSPTIAALVRIGRGRLPALNWSISLLELHGNPRLRRVLRRTRPVRHATVGRPMPASAVGT